MRYKVKSQLYSDAEAQQKGAKQILDDCTWSSCAAAVSWASGYTVDYSAADGVAAERIALKRVEKQGVADNGGSQSESIKVIKQLGGKARYAKSWEDAMQAAKQGAALTIWVQQPLGFPEGLEISKWHDRWAKWWAKTDPSHLKAGYGHSTSAGWCEDHGWQWACPTRDEKTNAEKYGVQVTEEQLRQIANSKVKAGWIKADFKALLIVTHPGKVIAPAPAPAPVSAPVSAPAPAPVRAREEKPVAQIEQHLVDAKVTAAIGEAARRVDWGAVGKGALVAAGGALAAASATKGFMNKIGAALKHIAANTQLDEMILDGIRTFATVTLSTALALGVPLLEVDGPNWKLAISAGLSSAAVILIKAMDPKFTGYGAQEKTK